jgi:prepilin-type N-terminal cleavage/methylation domain-containing protein
MKALRENRGITLIELLVALGLMSIVTMAIYTIMTTGIKSYNTSFKQAENQGVVRAAMLSLSTSMRSADTVQVSGSTLIIGDETVTLSGTNLIASKATGTPRTIAKNITAFTVSSDGAMITITLQTTQGAATNTLTSMVHVKPY